MARAATVWLAATSVATLLLWLVALWAHHTNWLPWLAAGVGMSLTTLAASRATVALLGFGRQPWPRLLLTTSVRTAIPLAMLLAIAVTRPGWIDKVAMLYFLPYQFITLVAGTAGELQDVKPNS